MQQAASNIPFDGGRVLSEALGEGVVVDLELGDLFVLVGGDGDEGGALEGEGVEGAPAHAEHVVGLDHVNARQALVHRVEDYLKRAEYNKCAPRLKKCVLEC